MARIRRPLPTPQPMALSTRFRRRLQEGLSYGLALEGISAAQVAWLNAQKAKG